MERSIQFHSLLKDELVYEVQIRSETPASTVDALRKQLRNLLVEAPSEAVLETELPYEIELNTVSNKITELSASVDKYVRQRDRHSISRAKALGSHLFHRLARIHSDLNPEFLVKKAELQARLDVLLSRIDSPNPGPGGTAGNSEIMTTGVRDFQVTCSGDMNISKWSIRFNGTTDPRSFLERVEELKEANGVSDDRLFSAAPHLFVDSGLVWYRGIKNTVACWSDLKTLLLEEFDPCDYNYRLMSEIRSRTQGENEPIHLYFAVMSGMFARLKSALPEEQRLEILLHNIRPQFAQQLALVPITTVQELKSNCRKLEAAMQRSKMFTDPPKVSANTLCSDFAFKGKQSQVSSVSFKQNLPLNSSLYKADSSYQQRHSHPVDKKQTKFTQHSGNIPVCYKCGKSSHNFRLCNAKPNQSLIRCFGCNKPGVIRPNCQNCQGTQSKGSVQKQIQSSSKNL